MEDRRFGAELFKYLAYFMWIGGAIAAIGWGLIADSWVIFFGFAIGCAVSGCVFYAMAELWNYIADIRLYTIKIKNILFSIMSHDELSN